jgi:hypothetical protein
MDKHVRELWDYLKDYGAENIHVEGGRKHNKIWFEYGGVERSYLISHSPSTEPHAVNNMKATLKRMLGPPLPAEEKQPRKLEEMMEELNTSIAVKYIGTPPVVTKPAKTWQPVRMSAYRYVGRNNKPTNVLYFMFPPDILQAHPEGMKVERLDDEHWKISSGGRAHFREYGGSVRLTFSDPETAMFGSIEAEAIEADGAILVYLPKEGRPAIAPPKLSKPWPTQATPIPATELTQRPVSATALMTQTTIEDEMREIIRRIQAIEATCPYHLVRLEGGRIQWRAPIIE